MCTVLWVDGKMMETVGDLRAWLGREPVHHDTGGRPVDDLDCLCNVDMAATCKLAGGHVDWNEWAELVFVRDGGG